MHREIELTYSPVEKMLLAWRVYSYIDMKLIKYFILLVCMALFSACGNNDQTVAGNEDAGADTGISLCKADCGGGEEISSDENAEAETEADEDKEENLNIDEEGDKNNEETSENNNVNTDDGDAASGSDDDSGDTTNDGDDGGGEENNESAGVEKAVVKISSYDVVKKKVVTATYDAFYLPGANWRVDCEEPCGLADDLLKKKVLGTDNAIEELLKLTGVDALAKYTPIEINVTSSSMCGNYADILAEKGYVPRYYSPKFPAHGSYMCLWEADDTELTLPLNDENAQKIEAQKVLVHEYSHIIFHGRVKTWPEDFEDFVKAFSFYVSGFWDGNGLAPENFPKITNACDPILETFANDVYNLCAKCGFQFSDVKILFEMIDSAKGNGPAISELKLKEIFDTITGHDSITECGLDWLGTY